MVAKGPVAMCRAAYSDRGKRKCLLAPPHDTWKGGDIKFGVQRDGLRHWSKISTKDMARAIMQVGADHFILSSDLGQSGNPTHPDGYKKLVSGLKKEGISQADIDKMMKTNPAKLLGLE